jgi:hypothetical protein
VLLVCSEFLKDAADWELTIAAWIVGLLHSALEIIVYSALDGIIV